LPISRGVEETENEAVIAIANLIAVSARTDPKGRGVDHILAAVVTGEEKYKLADAMESKMEHKRDPILSV